MGDWLGTIAVGESKIPVVYTVFMITDEDLFKLGGNASEVYYMLMETFSEMVKDLNYNKKFSSVKPIMMLENHQDAVMKYWTVSLPKDMSWHEVNENGKYQAVFYGDVQGETVALYEVNIGNEITGSELGVYKINGENKIVSVTCYDISDCAEWSEDDYSVAYRMMDTINDVIDQIISNENFSEIDAA